MKHGWIEKPLGAVCQFINRGVSPVYLDHAGVAVLNQKCVRNHKIDFGVGRRHDVKVKKVPTERFLRVGDVLVNSTGMGTLGRVAQLRIEPPEPMTVDSHVTIVRPSKDMFYTDFFGYALIAIEDRIQQGGEGCGGQTELSRTKLANDYSICYPTDLNEQRQIVVILDEVFMGIGAAVMNAGENLAKARNLFHSYLNSVFVQRGKGWGREKLEDTVEKTCSLSYGIVQPGEDVDGGLPIVRPTDLQSKIIGLSGLKKINPLLADGYRRTKLHGDELLLCVRGGTGSVSIAAKELAGSNVTRGIVPIRFNASIVIQRFGYYAFISKGVQNQIKAATYGTALMQINIRDLRKVLLDLPSLDIQKDLLEKFDEISANVGRLTSAYEQKAAAFVDLKRAILQKAFTGKLTARVAKTVQKAAE